MSSLIYFGSDILIWHTIRCYIRWRPGFLSAVCVPNLVHFQNATNQLKVMYLQNSLIPCVLNICQCLEPFILILRKVCKHFVLKRGVLSLILADLLISFFIWRRNSQDWTMLYHCACAEGRLCLVVELERHETGIVPVLCFRMGPKWRKQDLYVFTDAWVKLENSIC